MPNTTLAIAHYLHLTKDERYRWAAGEVFDAVGVSVPTWFYKGASSEPAIEVFCKYKLLTATDGIFMKHTNEGYEVTIPQKPAQEAQPLPEDIWNSLTEQQQDEWHAQNTSQMPCLRNLLDIRDGGSAYLTFRQFSKVRKNKKVLNVIHFMEIKDISELLQTLC